MDWTNYDFESGQFTRSGVCKRGILRNILAPASYWIRSVCLQPKLIWQSYQIRLGFSEERIYVFPMYSLVQIIYLKTRMEK